MTSFTPRLTSSRTSLTISSMVRLRSAPRVRGTMQKVQCMLQPCMIETNAVACCARELCSRMVACEPASSAVSTDRETRIVHPARAFFLEQLIDVIGDPMKFLRADDEIDDAAPR